MDIFGMKLNYLYEYKYLRFNDMDIMWKQRLKHFNSFGLTIAYLKKKISIYLIGLSKYMWLWFLEKLIKYWYLLQSFTKNNIYVCLGTALFIPCTKFMKTSV